MITGRRLIAGYTIRAVLPYVFLSLFLLTAVLFAQQAGRFAELALYTQVPFSLLADLSVALLPNVLVFTLPVAVLAGVMIGFARMGSDSEIVAMRAAGVGTWTLLWPVLIIGLLVTVATHLHSNEGSAAGCCETLRRPRCRERCESSILPSNLGTSILKFQGT